MSNPVCDCQWCVSACENAPGRFTMMEAARAITLGLAKKLVVVWDSIPGVGEVFAIRPKRKERWGACIFLKRGRCTLHDTGIKLAECRNYIHTMDDVQVRESANTVLMTWREPYADKVRGMLMAAKRFKKVPT